MSRRPGYDSMWMDRTNYSVIPKTKMINVSCYIYIDGLDIERVIETLRESSKDLEDPRMDIQIEDYYGDKSIRTAITGWRPMTDGEWEMYQKQLGERKEREKLARMSQVERDRAEFLRLKARFEPENGIKSTPQKL